MTATALDLCECGSGLEFFRCHGDPANDYAREQALREAEQIAVLFPMVRVRGARMEGFLDDVASRYPASDHIPAHELERGLELVAAPERDRLVASWAEPYEDRWESLTGAAGNRGAAARAFLIGVLRAGVAERQPTPREVVEPLENGRLHRSPFAALALVVPPQLVWSIDEMRAARVAHGAHRKPTRGMDAVEEVAYGLMSFEHVRRARFLYGRVAGELPLDGLPRASAMLASACEEVANELSAARAVCAALLIAYVEEGRLRQSGKLT